MWRSQVVDVLRFSYRGKKEIKKKLELTAKQAAEPYVVDAPDVGYCLAYRVKPLERTSLAKPEGFRFPHKGWLRVTDGLAQEWPAAAEQFARPVPQPQEGYRQKKPSAEGKQLPEKDENEVTVLKKALQSSYIKRHNSITNRLRSACEAHGKVVVEGTDKECLFDALIKDYDASGRDLLIEAKSSIEVAFCRMAVGQLLDYRWQLATRATTDLALLFSEEPGSHILAFLGHVSIRALWFDGDEAVDSSGFRLF